MKRALALCVAAACASPIASGGVESIFAGDAARGQSIANKICAACHGNDGNSPTPANPKLAGQIPEYMRKQLTNFRSSDGRNPERVNPIMGGMAANLTEENIADVAAFFASQRPKPGAMRDQDALALGRRIWRGGDASKGLPACAACHGAQGAGLPSQYPRLAGQYADYSEAQLKAFRTGERHNDANKVMQTIASRMSDRDIHAVADYIAGLR